MTGWISDPRCVNHLTGAMHPERPDRLRAIHRSVRQAGLISSPDPFPDYRMDFGISPVARSSVVEMAPVRTDEKLLRLVHTEAMIEKAARICAVGGVLDQGDTPVCQDSYDAAIRSLSCATTAVDSVMSGRVRRAFACARPPGHHAEPDRSMGFCLFSNIAIAARYAQQKYGIGRIAIIDFDVHHGNGTQACLEDDASIFFVSLHQDPNTLYPRTGHAWEIGTGTGKGYTLNLPMDPGSGDEEYHRIIETRVIPEMDDFRPELVMISAGFDAHHDDPLADMKLTDEGFALITHDLVSIADRHCGGKVVSVLEGGYNLLALGRSVVQHVLALDAE